MNEVVTAFVVGLIAGAIFAFFDLPIPAPPVLSGLMGIVGIFSGYKLVQFVTENWDQITSMIPF
ncbi:MAG: DUF1427 family protein [Halobacteria archaeon]|nr:DUF1427 family protein [Halobacteria archaeon]